MGDFDRIITSTPMNATAGRVMARGEHWTPEAVMPPGLQHWRAPPPTKAVPTTETNLTGMKFGRFTVVGMLGESGGKNRGNRWICRCVCGDYESRSAKAIKIASMSAPETLSNQCWYCMQWKATQSRYKKKGSKAISEFLNAKPRVIGADLKTPETVVADAIRENLSDPETAYQIAVKVIGKLNRAGYRVVREATPQPPRSTPTTGCRP